jgi:hypothetical protein
MIRGSVDVVTTTEVLGWAYGVGRDAPVLVQAVLNHEVLGEMRAGDYRFDLASAGLGDGYSGFAIKLFRPVDPLYLPFIVVKVDGGDAELPRAPLLGFGEFFSALYAKHPGAGRSRSVLGGLWTERTDAASLLRGKVEIGQVPAQAAPAIKDLIYEGFAIVALGDIPFQADWQSAPAERVGGLLEDAALLTPLRAVLEDHPLVSKVEWLTGDTALGQPSARNIAPSQAECVEIIMPFGSGVVLEVVRDSHKLPEFTPHGVSRWVTAGATAVTVDGFLDRYELAAGTAVMVGAGTIYRLRCEAGAAAAQVTCLPARGMSAALGAGERTEEVSETGIRVWGMSGLGDFK